jgi:integrase
VKVPTARHGTGKRWDVRWRDDTDQQHHKAFDRKKGPGSAEEFLAKVTTDLSRGTYTDPRAGREKFRAYAERWRTAQVHRPNTVAHVETMLRRHVYPAFGDRALNSIRPSEVQAWVRHLEQDLAPSTIGIVYSFFASIYKAAALDGAIPVTPCRRIRLPKPEPSEVVPLATDKVEALIAAMPARYQAIITLAAGTGLRQGEVFGLELDRIDFLRRTLRVDQQLVLHGKGEPVIGPPKTPASYRTIPLPQVVIDALAAHLATFPAVEVELLDTTMKPTAKRRVARLLFTTPSGRPLRRNRFDELWCELATAAELPDGASFHDLRHYYASLLIAHGENVKVVQKRLGHKSGMETLDTYAHLWPDTEDGTREAVDAVLGGKVATVVSEAAP